MSDKAHSLWTWKQCRVCHPEIGFKTTHSFIQHLRDFHCSKEGGSFVCLYGYNNVCSSLPLEGVSDKDYEDHIIKHHVLHHTESLEIGMSTSQESASGSLVHKSYSASFLSSLLEHSQPNLLSDQYKWTVYNSTQNLPAVLNDPRRSKRESDFFTKTWGDSFVDRTAINPCPFLPEINWGHFEHYLTRISKRFKQHAKRSNTPVSKVVGDIQETFISHGSIRRQDKIACDAENIPKIFMQADFNLADPDTFSTVLPWSLLQPSVASGGSISQRNSAKLLQEKLSHYLDVVEVQIARQISIRSEAFFHAMTSRDAVMDQLKNVIQSVCELRTKIHTIEDVLVTGAFHILSLKRSRTNYIQVYSKLKLMATVQQTQPTIQLLLSTSEFVGALDLIHTTQEVLTQELAGIHSLRHLSSQLAEIEKVIDKMMQTDFVRYVTGDLNRPFTENNLIMEEERLIAIVLGMLRLRCHNFIQTYKEEACTALKATVKQTVIEVISEADDIDLEGNVGSLVDQMRLLDFSKWLDLLQEVFNNLKKLLKRIQAVHAVMTNTINIAAGKSSNDADEDSNIQVNLDEGLEVMVTPVDHVKLTSLLKEMLCFVCDHAHERCAKLLAARAKDGSLDKLSPGEFVRLAQCIESFTTEFEEVCGRRSTALRLALQSQANRFVTRFHEEKKNKLSLILDSEQWKQADVPDEFQKLVDHITRTGSLTIPKKNTKEEPEEIKTQTYLTVGGQNYAVVGTVLLLLKMVVEYCQCAKDIPMIAPDLLTRLLDLLKVFNSRTCQLVLGAGALQLVGLKTITTKHLALASRCLQLMVFFIPEVKYHFEQKLPPKQHFMTKHFEQILKDYNNHVQEISNKLVAIISDMFESNLSKWEVKAPVPSACFRAISKQLSKLYELVSDLLPPDQLEKLFNRMNEVFKGKLRQHLLRLKVSNDGGPQHGLVTQELTFYMQNLRNLNMPCYLNHNMDDLWLPR